jgi:hypothetical protein
MAKPLSTPQPTGPGASLREPGVGAAALGQMHVEYRVPASPRAAEPAVETGEPANIKREFVLTASTDQTLREAVSLFERATGTTITNSHLLRALLRVAAHALPEIEKQAAGLGPMKRPSNARRNEAGRDEFERRLAQVLLAGFQAGGRE